MSSGGECAIAEGGTTRSRMVRMDPVHFCCRHRATLGKPGSNRRTHGEDPSKYPRMHTHANTHSAHRTVLDCVCSGCLTNFIVCNSVTSVHTHTHTYKCTTHKNTHTHIHTHTLCISLFSITIKFYLYFQYLQVSLTRSNSLHPF